MSCEGVEIDDGDRLDVASAVEEGIRCLSGRCMVWCSKDAEATS